MILQAVLLTAGVVTAQTQPGRMVWVDAEGATLDRVFSSTGSSFGMMPDSYIDEDGTIWRIANDKGHYYIATTRMDLVCPHGNFCTERDIIVATDYYQAIEGVRLASNRIFWAAGRLYYLPHDYEEVTWEDDEGLTHFGGKGIVAYQGNPPTFDYTPPFHLEWREGSESCR